jgi:hypothetical protein
MEELSVITTIYEIYKKLIQLTTVIDKKFRYSIGEPAVAGCNNLLEQLILAKHAPKTLKASYLIKADATAELLALKLRTILELKLANETNILKIQAKLTEGRRQISGWRKSVSSLFL